MNILIFVAILIIIFVVIWALASGTGGGTYHGREPIGDFDEDEDEEA